MSKRGKSVRDPAGGYRNYDSRGRRTGSSIPNAFGGYTNYDAKGKKVGRSEPGFLGDMIHYDAKGRRIGKSTPGAFGSYSHYDRDGKRVGRTDRGVMGDLEHSDSTEACYIATCVYGSYDCPQVLILRHFRDDTLKRSVFGRAFIAVYYALSPHLVRRFGDRSWFHRPCKKLLDMLICHLEH